MGVELENKLMPMVGVGSREREKRNYEIVVLDAKMKVWKSRVLVSTFST
jgi:hypothetical protein